MIQTVVKRDGRVVGYNDEKIKAAIRKAMLQTEMGEDEALIHKITDRISMTGNERMTVEEIQDKVELELMKSPRKEVAKRYIAYRDQRNIARRAKTQAKPPSLLSTTTSCRMKHVRLCVTDTFTSMTRTTIPPRVLPVCSILLTTF